MKMSDITAYIRKNYFVIVIGVCALVLLMFLSENLVSDDSTDNSNSSDMETQLETFLSKLQGVGECDVIIFTETEKVSSFSSSVSETISGIAVVCSGGGNSSVKSMIIEVLTRLFGISGSRISINEKSQ